MPNVSSYRKRRFFGLASLSLMAVLAAPVHAEAPMLWLDGPPASLIEAGHGDFSVQMVPRYGIMVTDVGEPDADGNVYSFNFSVSMSSFNSTVVAINGMRAWRISVVSGELIGSTFQVRSNDTEEMSITSAFGPLTGLVPGDLMLVERIPVVQPVQPIQQPTVLRDFDSTPSFQQVKL